MPHDVTRSETLGTRVVGHIMTCASRGQVTTLVIMVLAAAIVRNALLISFLYGFFHIMWLSLALKFEIVVVFGF